jgi:hypothetical protein
MENHIKQIIQNYQYYELDETQKDLVSKWASNSDEFDALKRTFIATEAMGKDEVNPTIKQRLDVRFAEKHKNERLVWYNKLWIFLWPEDTQLYKRPLLQFAAICLIVVFTIPFFPNLEKQQLAMNEKKQEVQQEEQAPTDKTVDRKNDSERTEDILNEEKEAEVLVEPLKSEERAEEPKAVVEKQSGWELVDEEMRVTEDAVADDFSNQRQKKSDNLDNLGLADSRAAQGQNSEQFASDADLPMEESLSASGVSKNAHVRKKVDTKETIDLLTALY